MNADTGQATEIRSAQGSADAVVCPDGKQLFYRRGRTVVRQQLSVSPTEIAPAGDPISIISGAATHVFACVQDSANDVALW